MSNSKVVIDIIAPNSRTYNMLEFILQQYGNGRFELGRGNRPDLAVVDFDKSDVKVAFRKYRSRFPEVPAILLLNQPAEYETLASEDRIGAEFILLKPFAAKDFISKINECLDMAPGMQADVSSGVGGRNTAGRPGGRGGNSAQTDQADPSNKKGSRESPRSAAARAERTHPLQVPSTSDQAGRPGKRHRTWEALEKENIAYSFALESDIDMANAAAVENIHLKIDSKLLGYLKNAISQQVSAQSIICLSVRNDVKFFISPGTNAIGITGENVNLTELALQDFNNQQISVCESAMLFKDVQLQIELEAFLWKLALYTYRGYLPEGVNVHKPVYLKYWPNLTRLEPTPNAMRIASLLNRQPVALAFIVRILNIPQKHVFNFYAAANAIGFSGPAVREVDNMLLPSYSDESLNSSIPGYAGESAFRNKSAS